LVLRGMTKTLDGYDLLVNAEQNTVNVWSPTDQGFPKANPNFCRFGGLRIAMRVSFKILNDTQ
jgi:hypothetical protein